MHEGKVTPKDHHKRKRGKKGLLGKRRKRTSEQCLQPREKPIEKKGKKFL